MGSTFNPQILVEKLAKLNSSQQSIETLSHWCIFHMNKAKQVVETWASQFHCSPRDQRLAFLYLANDILQNSRRKGSEFVGEFWKVLPDALRDVIDNGDELGRNSALRLVNILDERKVFGSRGQVLKEELVGRHRETDSRNEKQLGLKLKQPAGNPLDKIVSVYQAIHASQANEDALISKCRNAISIVEKMDKEISGDIKSAKANGPGVVDELKGQHATLRDCIEQLKAVESSRMTLVSYLKDALHEQEMKVDLVHSQLLAAHTQLEKADNLCRQLLIPSDPRSRPGQLGQRSTPVMYTQQSQSEDAKSAAAAMAEKLTASTSSAEMLSYVLSSLASEGVIGNSLKQPSLSNDYPLQKKPKIDNDNDTPQPYVPSSQNPQPPIQPDQQPPPPPSSSPPMPPVPPVQPYPSNQFMQSAINPSSMSLPGFPAVGPPANGYQNYQIEGGFYSQQSAMQ